MRMQVPPQILVVAICAVTSLLGIQRCILSYRQTIGNLVFNWLNVSVFLSVNRFVRILFANTLAGYIHDHYHVWWHFVAILSIAEMTSNIDSRKIVSAYTIFADAGSAFGLLVGFVLSDILHLELGLPILYLAGIVLLLSAGFALCVPWLGGWIV